MVRKQMQWSDMSSRQKTSALVMMGVQVALAVTAWLDLARRPADLVQGGKAKWAAIIAINYVGPILYFTRGRIPR